MRDALRASARGAGVSTPRLRCQLVESVAALDRDAAPAAGRTSAYRSTWSTDRRRLARPAIVVIANEFFDALPGAAMGHDRPRVGTNAASGSMRRGDLAFVDELHGSAADRRPDAALRPARASANRPNAFASIGKTVLDTLAPAGRRRAAGDAGRSTTATSKSALGDTLQAVRGHAHEHPLTSPGEADLSAQVDFEALAAAARARRPRRRRADHPVRVPRPARHRRARLAADACQSRKRAAEIEIGVARLIAPDGMGDAVQGAGPAFADTADAAGPGSSTGRAISR